MAITGPNSRKASAPIIANWAGVGMEENSKVRHRGREFEQHTEAGYTLTNNHYITQNYHVVLLHGRVLWAFEVLSAHPTVTAKHRCNYQPVCV